MQLKDFFWGVFENSGDTTAYLLYKNPTESARETGIEYTEG